jgi:DNA-binding PadR family transcriptional regulator
MQSDAFTLYKLIILFLLNKVDFPLTNAQISNFILEKEYTNYFNVQQSLSELIEAEFVTVETINHSSHYRITPSGRETLSFFGNMISSAIQADILDYLRKNELSMRDEVSTLSDYYEAKKGEYMVHLRVLEKEEAIIDLNLAVPTEEDAAKICHNWRSQSQKIYAYVLSNLLKEDTD